MTKIDPYISLREWRISLYRGDESAIDRFLEGIESGLPPDWTRDREYEADRLRPERTRCYKFDREGDTSLRLWLQLVTKTRVRGGPIQILRHPPSGDGERIAQLVTEFTDACVLPNAKAANVQMTRPAFGVRSSINSTIEMQLTQFADSADGKWPLPSEVVPLWDNLISAVLTEQAAFNENELAQWLKDSGWEDQAVKDLPVQFFADVEWLANRLEAMAR